MDLLTFILCILITFLVLHISYRYLTSRENPWQKAGIPVLSKWDSILPVINFNLFPLHLGLLNNYKKYGKLFGLCAYGQTMLYVGDPEIIRLILVKDFQHFVNRIDTVTGDHVVDNMMSIAQGDQWKRIRNITSPTFSTGKIKKMISITEDCIITLGKNFDKEVALKAPTDVKKFLSAFMMDCIASTAFGTKIDSHNDPNSTFMKVASKLFSQWGQLKIFISVFVNSILKVLHLTKYNMRLFDFFEKLTRSLIEERKKSGQIRNDFLQQMIDSSISNLSSDADEGTECKENSEGKMSLQNGKNVKGLSDDEILSQCIIFLVGGFEPVSSTITFALYELALNEHIQDELISEIDEVLRLNQKKLTYDNVQAMKYLDKVIYETLRKYPPAAFSQRLALTDYEVKGRNLVIPKNTPVVIPVYALHHDEEYFPDPERFDPNRFSAEEKAQRDPYVYLPFGAGPRNCIAMRFALVQVKFCLAYLLSRYRFRRCSKTQVPLKLQMQPQLIAKNIFLVLEKREDAVL